MMNDREKLVELLAEYAGYFGVEAKHLANHLIANGVTMQRWISAKEPPKEYRDECMELIPFLVCESGTEYPFRAFYDGKVWGDGWSEIPVTHWMPLPKPAGLKFGGYLKVTEEMLGEE